MHQAEKDKRRAGRPSSAWVTRVHEWASSLCDDDCWFSVHDAIGAVGDPQDETTAPTRLLKMACDRGRFEARAFTSGDKRVLRFRAQAEAPQPRTVQQQKTPDSVAALIQAMRDFLGLGNPQMAAHQDGINSPNQAKLKVPGVLRCVRCGRGLLQALPTGEAIGRHCAKITEARTGQQILPKREARIKRFAVKKAESGQVDWVGFDGLIEKPISQGNAK